MIKISKLKTIYIITLFISINSQLAISIPPSQGISATQSTKSTKSTKSTDIFNKVTWEDMSTASQKDDFNKSNQPSSDDSELNSLSKYFKAENDNINDSDDMSSDQNVFSDNQDTGFDDSGNDDSNPFG